MIQTGKQLTAAAPMILTTKIILIRATPLALGEAADGTPGNRSGGQRTQRTTM
jgi:hypothetical protein